MKKAVSIIALVLALLMLPTIPVFANSEATTVSARPVFKYATLSFKGGVNMHFSVYYGDDVSSYKDYGLIFWTESQEEEDYTYAKAVEKKMTITHKADATDDTLEGYEGSKKFICPVEAHKMGDSIYVQGYIENSDGTYTYGKYVREYSPQIYAKNKLYGASKTSDQKLVNMIKSLLNFGADAQIYFDYKTDDLVNSIIQAASSADTLAAAIAKGGYVELEEDITLTSALTIAGNATINGNGKTISGASVSVATGNSATFNNVVFEAPLNSANNASCLYASNLTGKIVIDGCTFKNTQWDCIQITPVAGAEIVINNCTFIQTVETNAGNKTRFIHVEAATNSNSDVKITITNNHFGDDSKLSEAIIDLYYVKLESIDFGGNNIFEKEPTADIYVCGSSAARTISKAEAYAKLGGIGASSAADLAAAITNGGSVVLTDDITLTDAIKIEKDVIINGNGKTITAASADRVFNVEGTSSNISIDLRDLNIVSNSGKAYDRGISFYQNTGKIRLNVDNCNITAGHYAINVAKENSDIEINVKNSEITGYAAAQTWSANSKLSFENCTLNGVNKWDGTDNDFDTIVVNDTAKDSELSFTNCTITATENGTAKELFFGVNCNADIIVNDCSFTKNGTAVNASDVPTEEYSYYSGNGNSGTILIDGERLVYNAAGLHTALKKGGNVNLTNDINMAGVEWAALTAEKAIVLNGNGHTISDLKVRHYTSVTNGVQYGFGFISNAKADVTIKKLTFTNADVGPEQAQIDAQKGNIGGVVMGYSSGKTVLEDVTVKNSTVSGYGKLGCLIGYVPSGTVTLTNCASTNNTINGGTNMGGLIGTVDSKATINRSNCTVDGIIFNKVRSEEQEPLYTLTSDVTVTTDGSASDYSDFTLRAGSTFNLNGSGYYYGYKADYYTVITGNWGHVTIGEETYKFCEEIAVGVTTISGTLPNFATQGEDIVLSENVTGNAAIKSNTSNYKVGFVLNGGTLDGGGKTISVTGTGDHGIEVTSGTIENVTVTNAYRGIMTYNTTADSVITIDNVTVDGCGYGINTGVGTGGKLVVTNSTINGWSSWANLASASFTNCSFGTSTYYSGEMFQHYLRPYVTTTFEDCDIGQGFYLDLTKLPAGSTVTLKNCTCGSVKLTKANFADYVKIIKAVDGKTDVYAVNGDDLSNLIWGE